MSEIRNQVQCRQCGQTDDHPKVHVGSFSDGGQLVDEVYHHDCLPHAIKEELIASSDKAAATIKACEGGLKGDKLRAHIEKKG